METAGEVLAVFKTTPEVWERFEARLRELHPYEVPEIVAVRPEEVSEGYAQWVEENVGQEAEQGDCGRMEEFYIADGKSAGNLPPAMGSEYPSPNSFVSAFLVACQSPKAKPQN